MIEIDTVTPTIIGVDTPLFLVDHGPAATLPGSTVYTAKQADGVLCVVLYRCRIIYMATMGRWTWSKAAIYTAMMDAGLI